MNIDFLKLTYFGFSFPSSLGSGVLVGASGISSERRSSDVLSQNLKVK